jgi:hypothetical protein
MDWDGLNPLQVIWGFNPTHSRSTPFILGENEPQALTWIAPALTTSNRSDAYKPAQYCKKAQA